MLRVLWFVSLQRQLNLQTFWITYLTNGTYLFLKIYYNNKINPLFHFSGKRELHRSKTLPIIHPAKLAPNENETAGTVASGFTRSQMQRKASVPVMMCLQRRVKTSPGMDFTLTFSVYWNAQMSSHEPIFWHELENVWLVNAQISLSFCKSDQNY